MLETDPSFWNDIQALGLISEAPSTAQFRSARCSAPGGFAIPTHALPRSGSPGGPRPASLLVAQHHNSSPSSPAGAPVLPALRTRLDDVVRHSSMPGNVPLPAAHEQAYKELYDSLETSEATQASAATSANAATAQAAARAIAASAAGLAPFVAPDVREGAILDPSPKKSMGRNMSMRKPLVLSMNVRDKDALLHQQQKQQVAQLFTSFRRSGSGLEQDLGTTGRQAAGPCPAESLNGLPSPSMANTLTHRLSHIGLPVKPPKPPSGMIKVPSNGALPIPRVSSNGTLPQAASTPAVVTPAGPRPHQLAPAPAPPPAAVAVHHAPTPVPGGMSAGAPARSGTTDLDLDGLEQWVQGPVSTPTPRVTRFSIPGDAEEPPARTSAQQQQHQQHQHQHQQHQQYQEQCGSPTALLKQASVKKAVSRSSSVARSAKHTGVFL